MTIQKASGCLIFREIFLLRGSRWEKKNIVLELHPSAFDKKSQKAVSLAFVFVFRKHLKTWKYAKEKKSFLPIQGLVEGLLLSIFNH